MADLGALPISARLANVPVATVGYLLKLVWPARLAVLYPLHPAGVAQILGSTLVLVLISSLAFLWRRAAPSLAAGWAWYLTGLLPVIGLIQVGSQVMADRYTYVPQIGIAVALAWGARAATQRFPTTRKPIAVLWVSVLLILVNLGLVQAVRGRWDAAAAAFAKSLVQVPRPHLSTFPGTTSTLVDIVEASGQVQERSVPDPSAREQATAPTARTTSFARVARLAWVQDRQCRGSCVKSGGRRTEVRSNEAEVPRCAGAQVLDLATGRTVWDERYLQCLPGFYLCS